MCVLKKAKRIRMRKPRTLSQSLPQKSSSSTSLQQQQQPIRTVYTSIVSELFEGSLISQVQCLECEHVSTTTESFLHLSLPIPSKEYLQTLHSRLVAKQQLAAATSTTSISSQQQQQQQQGWLSWLFDTMKGFVWSQTIKLTDCLTAFFSDDDLKDDNMYSCDKCKK